MQKSIRTYVMFQIRMYLVTERPAHAQGAAYTHRATHTYSNVRVTTAASETEGVAAVSWIESRSRLDVRWGRLTQTRSVRQELHKESRRRHRRGERESLHSPQLDRERDAARQRAAATRTVVYIHEPYPWAQSVVARR